MRVIELQALANREKKYPPTVSGMLLEHPPEAGGTLDPDRSRDALRTPRLREVGDTPRIVWLVVLSKGGLFWAPGTHWANKGPVSELCHH